jgi:glycosyltransferase involved in cell wall biosynthesis
MKKALTLSIVIPAYNEENHLRSCLESIEHQTIQPDEVIVVDNNSVDGTVAVARSFSFVTVLSEPQQGLIPARNTGFSAANGTVLGRINADAALDKRWVETVKARFEDDGLAGMSGPAVTKVFPGIPWLHSDFWSRVYLWSTRAYFRASIMWGANMAIRTAMWERIKSQADLEDSFVHEDQDLSLLIASHGGVVRIDRKMKIYTDEQSYFYWPKFREYVVRRWRTKAHHQLIGSYHTMKMTPGWWSFLVSIAMLIPVMIFITGSILIYYTSLVILALTNNKKTS